MEPAKDFEEIKEEGFEEENANIVEENIENFNKEIDFEQVEQDKEVKFLTNFS